MLKLVFHRKGTNTIQEMKLPTDVFVYHIHVGSTPYRLEPIGDELHISSPGSPIVHVLKEVK